MRAARAALLLIAPLLSWSLIAHAAEVATVGAGVRVMAPSCPISPLPFADFVDALRVELAGRGTSGALTLVTPVIAPCDTTTLRVEITVADEGSGRSVMRAVSLEDVALAARPRVLALAVAELLRVAPRPAESPAPRPVEDPRPAKSEGMRRRYAVDAVGVASLFPNRATTLWGGRVALAIEGRRWHGGAFGEAAAGQRSYGDGDVDVQSFGGGVLVGPRWEAGRFALAPALVGALVWARVEGRARAPDVVARAGGALAVAVRGRLALTARLARITALQVFLEGGLMARGFDATVDGGRAAGVSGTSLVLGVGLRVAP
jgi:hypothetical protein